MLASTSSSKVGEIKSDKSRFGSEFDEVWPKNDLELNEFGLDQLKSCLNINKPDDVTLEELLENSAEFPIAFPINTCRIIGQPKERYSIIEKEANSAYPLIHERVLWLYLQFLEHKRNYSQRSEKEIYSNLSLTGLTQRLLDKRCVSFVGEQDKYLLITGENGYGGFQNIGTDKETPPLLLQNCLSYDEMKLSAFLSISSYTEFINDGNRKNCGKVEENKNQIENYGCIIGIIGARLTRRDVMEFQDIVISKTQNTIENGYGNNEIMPLYNDCKINGKNYGNSRNKDDIFNNVVMKKRNTISFDTLLLDSEKRSKESNKRGYLHVVGIGLGVWRIAEQQEEIFLRTFSQRIRMLGDNLKNISYIHFSWFDLTECGDLKNNAFYKIDGHPDGGIKIFISRRNPAEKLREPEFENCLVIVSYAWDGNALPGNEFWTGSLSSSGDPAAACCSLITELHNPHINKKKICGENLHIASEKYGILHISDYAKNILSNS